MRRLFRAVLALGALFVLAACAKDAPQDALDPAGPVAQSQHNLFMVTFWIATGVFIFVEGLIVFAAIKFRDHKDREEPKQIHGNTRLEFTWTLIPALILAGLAVPTVLSIFDLSAAAEPEDLHITVTAKQWWWEYEYTNVGDPAVITANEMVVPTGRRVFLDLESSDVIHSFWVPRLAGKQDVVPGRTNTLHFTAVEEGDYEGQCAEFCALSHANMRLRVVSVSPTRFDEWVREQQAPAVEPSDPDATAGKELFANTDLLGSNSCIACHAISGFPEAAGRIGPDLTHFASREMFAGYILQTNEQNVHDWIRNTRALKPGVVMPVFEGLLTEEQISQLTAYLMSLE
jgi:cytochrome c oxidase subunit 2